jgi:hypothetical protein
MLNYRTVLLAQNMFRSTPEPVTGFINNCIDDIVPTVTVRIYPNQKPRFTGNIRTEPKDRTATFKERDSNPEFKRNPTMPANHQTGKASIQD